MRFIDRLDSDTPRVLYSQDVKNFQDVVNSYLSDIDNYKRPPRFNWDFYRDRGFMGDILKVFYKKCAYCESPIFESELKIDYFRPVGGALRTNGDVDPKHYCWLATEWRNFYLACSSCTASKRNHFPVQKVGGIGDDLNELRKTEEPYLIDPCFDQPHIHLNVNESGHLFGITAKGKTTIDILNLNRFDLVIKRKTLLLQFLTHIISLKDNDIMLSDVFQIENMIKPHVPYSGTLIIFLYHALTDIAPNLTELFERSELNSLPISKGFLESGVLKKFVLFNRDKRNRIAHTIDPSLIPAIDYDALKMRYIKKVIISCFKGIGYLELDFPKQDESSSPCLALLGNNGMGKTCILQAITLGLLGPSLANEVVKNASSCLSEDAFEGFVEIEFWHTTNKNRIIYHKNKKPFYGNKNVAPIVLAYGAHRLFTDRQSSRANHGFDFRVSTLFDGRAMVKGASKFFKSLYKDKKLLSNAITALSTLLSDEESTVELIRSKEIVVKSHGVTQRLANISAGYKSIVGIASDIMDVLYAKWNGLESAQAIVLIDEIDAHLHPVWRLRILQSFRETFPMVQFIVSTHDPLILRSLRKEEIRVLSREEGALVASDEVPNIQGVQIDQLLTSNLFGLNSTLSSEVESNYSEFYNLLSKNQISEVEEKRISELEEKINGLEMIGNTTRERLMLKVIDRFIAERMKESSFDEWSEETLDLLSSAINEAGIVLND